MRNEPEESYKALLDRFLSLPSTFATKADENALMAKLTLHNVFARLDSDMFLNSLLESSAYSLFSTIHLSLIPPSSYRHSPGPPDPPIASILLPTRNFHGVVQCRVTLLV